MSLNYQALASEKEKRQQAYAQHAILASQGRAEHYVISSGSSNSLRKKNNPLVMPSFV
ncbi:hypothetical protein [Shewanella indica]|uniref:hypothetical protein n=1 Tax=Shewanella indica TaxID=768528 RepID=UPI003003DF82